ncbi:MAG: efflux RND transporter periplasmic adaptor subunit [Pirellulales bacterium]
MKSKLIPIIALALLVLSLPACRESEGQVEEEHHKIVVTSPIAKDVTTVRSYVCQIHSRRHIEVCALEGGYLEEVHVKEGQYVEEEDLMFKVVPSIYQAHLDTEAAEVQVTQIEFDNTQKLFEQNVVSQQEVALAHAKLVKAQAKLNLAQAELNFTDIKAPFDGIVDRLHEQKGSLVDEGDMLTTLSDNSVMWVYFNVPEREYLEYKAGLDQGENDLKIELVLANGEKFPSAGKIGAIEADFNNETGNIAFRADFPNPEGLLRHGQTGTVLISQVLKNALVIPQRATYEILAKKYAYVVEPAEEHGDDEHDDAEHAPEDAEETAEVDTSLVNATQVSTRATEGEADDDSEDADDGEEKAEHHHAEHGGEAADNHDDRYGIVRQREIVIEHEQDDIFVIKEGLDVSDKIVLEGILQVRDGDEVEYEFRSPEEVLSNLKYKAE